MVIVSVFGGWNSASVAASPLQQSNTLRFAVIGDYGTSGRTLADVSSMMKGWNPDLIITTGDNNYASATAAGFDQAIGQYFNSYIYPYLGSYPGGAVAAPNRFFPALGNHDMDGIVCSVGSCTGAYLDYFTLPGNERYYDFVEGPVHFFMVSSDPREPDGNSATSVQANWLRSRLAASTTRWKVVVVHHAPYTSSNPNGPELALRWPYAQWGASIVLSGHDHNYERLRIADFPYIVNGAGGTSLYPFGPPIAGSIVRYNDDYGAMLVEANETSINFRFYNRSQQLIDTYTLPDTSPTPTPPSSGSVDLRIMQSADDVEEVIGSGLMVHNSSDLEMIDDSIDYGLQSVGLRFIDVNVPKGAKIQQAYIEFVVDESDSIVTNLEIQSLAQNNTPPFTLTNFDLSGRPRSTATTIWTNIEPWNTVGGLVRTPDLASIIQEVTARNDWQVGNALGFVISGTGRRTAVAYDGSSSRTARLHIDWSYDSGAEPTATAQPPTPLPSSTATPTPSPTEPVAIACAGSGNVVREVWNGVKGYAINDLLNHKNYPDSPSQTTTIQNLLVGSSQSDRFGTRIRGYLCPPISGNYTFWISGDDESQFFLSSDDSPQNKKLIASVPEWTNPLQWEKYTTQKSASISLKAGKHYFFDILHKEDVGDDHLAVAWQGPQMAQEVIEGRYLLPYSATGANGSIDVHVAQREDDVEQAANRGTMAINSRDLEFGRDIGLTNERQLVGIRFQDLAIPPNATITSAYIEFVVGAADASRNAHYGVSAHASDDAPPFGTGKFALTSLPRTGGISWKANSWRRVGERQRTSDLKTIMQEIVQRSGWQSGNDIAFIFESASGRRVAYSYDKSRSKAPLLHVEWQIGTEFGDRDFATNQNILQVSNLAVDFEDGAPGSQFHLTGEHFFANSDVTILVNEMAIGSAHTDENGLFEFEIATTGMLPGTLIISTDVAPTEQTTFRLAQDLPVRAPEDDSEESEGDGNGSDTVIYLPLVNR